MTTKPKITITPKEGNIQFDIRQGNQTRWFSVEEEPAKELYDILGDVWGKQQEITEEDALNRLAQSYPFSANGINSLLQAQLVGYNPVHTSAFTHTGEDDWIEREMAAFLDRKGVERDYERQRTPKVNREEL